jgi:hypothetical protein
VSKSALLREIAVKLTEILVSNGYQTNLGEKVQYGITVPSWRNVDEIQWIDGEEAYQERLKSLATVTISAVGYGDRSELLEKGIRFEEDLKQCFAQCCLARGRINVSKAVEESGDNSAINVVFEVVLPLIQ